jgi:hypothetical protein
VLTYRLSAIINCGPAHISNPIQLSFNLQSHTHLSIIIVRKMQKFLVLAVLVAAASASSIPSLFLRKSASPKGVVTPVIPCGKLI